MHDPNAVMLGLDPGIQGFLDSRIKPESDEDEAFTSHILSTQKTPDSILPRVSDSLMKLLSFGCLRKGVNFFRQLRNLSGSVILMDNAF
jgi:hypothetical protein